MVNENELLGPAVNQIKTKFDSKASFRGQRTHDYISPLLSPGRYFTIQYNVEQNSSQIARHPFRDAHEWMNELPTFSIHQLAIVMMQFAQAYNSGWKATSCMEGLL